MACPAQTGEKARLVETGVKARLVKTGVGAAAASWLMATTPPLTYVRARQGAKTSAGGIFMFSFLRITSGKPDG